MKYHSLSWLPPKLSDLLDELEEYVVCPSEWCKTFTLVYSTTCRIHKLMERKSEKNLAKRVLLGCFGIRDLGKFNKYQRRLGVLALSLQVMTQLHRPVYSVPHVPLTTNNQKKPHNIDIHAALLAVVQSRAQPQDEDSDSELAGELDEGDLPDRKSAKKMMTADKKPTAEGSRLCEMGKSTSVKPANQKVKSEEDGQRKSSKVKVSISRTSSCFRELTNGPEWS